MLYPAESPAQYAAAFERMAVSAGPLTHRGEARIKVWFPYSTEHLKALRTIEGVKWSQTHRCWHLPKTPAAWKMLKGLFQVEVVLPEPGAGQQNPPLPSAERAVSKLTVLAHPQRTDILGLRLPKEIAPFHLATVRNIHGRKWEPQ
jgi:hypothetical protein